MNKYPLIGGSICAVVLLVLASLSSVAGYQTVVVSDNHPPTDPQIAGPSRGKVGVSYVYDFVSIDPEQQNISYFIDWGDGTNINWTEYHPSGQNLHFMHTFDKMDQYAIRCKAKDTLGAESNWSYMEVPMEGQDLDSGFILCMTYYIFFIARHSGVACFVKYELIDYDTGKIIEKATSLFGIHLFKFLPTGHNYKIKVTTPKGSKDTVVKNLSFFYWLPIGVLILE
jgi:hypothetical protein